MPPAYENSINQQYSHLQLEKAIAASAQSSSTNSESWSLADLASIDEFHIRGRTATRELARWANLSKAMSVLDLGSGLGGPARTLATEWGCQVTGIDLTNAYVEAATALTEREGLEDRVTFLHGNVLDLPFDASRFDVVWLQHVSMNVEDKDTLFREAYRVLRPGGCLVIHEVGAGSHTPLHHPVPWADRPSLSFLTSPRRMRDLIEGAGVSVRVWTDTSAKCLAWLREHTASASDLSPDASGSPLHLLMGDNAHEKQQNVLRNLEENRIVVVQGVARRPEIPNSR